jgi:glycine cleavage system transcriptional repressor
MGGFKAVTLPWPGAAWAGRGYAILRRFSGNADRAGFEPAAGALLIAFMQRPPKRSRQILPKATPMETLMVLSAVGPDRPGLLDELSSQVLESGCHITDSRMTVLGDEFALIMLVAGNWNAVVKLEHAIERLEDGLGMHIHSRRTRARTGTENLIPYGVEVISVVRPGIVSDVANFFARRGINIEDVFTSTYPAPHTSAPMFTLHMTVGIPSDVSIASVRGEFMDFCDELNLDAVLAPVK